MYVVVFPPRAEIKKNIYDSAPYSSFYDFNGKQDTGRACNFAYKYES